MNATTEGVASRSDLLFEQLLEQVRIEVDSALDSIAADRDEARRICTRDLRFEPEGAALEVIADIAGDRALSGPRRDLPRRLLALRVLAEREMAGLFAGAGLDTQRLRRGTVVVSSVLNAIEPLQHAIHHAASTSGRDDQNYLSSCESAIAVRREDLCAALLLVPRIEAFSSAADDSAVRAVAPTLEAGEARRIAAFVDGRDGANGEAHRACFDALALRTLMDEHRGELEELLERVEAPRAAADETPPEVADSLPDADVLAGLEALLGRVDGDRVAYQFISRRLQKQKDMALMAGLKSLVEELGHIGKGLFSSYRTVIARSRDAESLTRADDGSTVVHAEELFRQAHAAEMEAERRIVKSNDEVCLEALKQMRGEAAKASLRRLGRAAKNRSRPLFAVAAILLGISLWLNLDLTPSTALQRLTYADFASGLNVSEFEMADGLLFVKVNGWDLLDTVQRRTRVEALVAIAEEKAFTSMLVAEDNGYPAASWSAEKGARLTEAKHSKRPSH